MLDVDDIATAATGFAAALILLLTWWHDHERRQLEEQFHGHSKVTAIRGSKPPAERRPPKKAAPR